LSQCGIIIVSRVVCGRKVLEQESVSIHSDFVSWGFVTQHLN
jgi:hypothetical protein